MDNLLEIPEEFNDPTLLGNRVERIINFTLPKWFIARYKKGGCNCNLRKDLLNNWHLAYREYKEAVREKKNENTITENS